MSKWMKTGERKDAGRAFNFNLYMMILLHAGKVKRMACMLLDPHGDHSQWHVPIRQQ